MSEGDRLKYFNWISQKHVDFVLCDKDTMQILCAVELDDRSHERFRTVSSGMHFWTKRLKAKLLCFIFPAKELWRKRVKWALSIPVQWYAGTGATKREVEEVPHLSWLRNSNGVKDSFPRGTQGTTILWMPQFPGMQTDKTLSGIKQKRGLPVRAVRWWRKNGVIRKN